MEAPPSSDRGWGVGAGQLRLQGAEGGASSLLCQDASLSECHMDIDHSSSAIFDDMERVGPGRASWLVFGEPTVLVAEAALSLLPSLADWVTS